MLSLAFCIEPSDEEELIQLLPAITRSLMPGKKSGYLEIWLSWKNDLSIDKGIYFDWSVILRNEDIEWRYHPAENT